MPRPAFGNRIERLIEAGFIAEGRFGDVSITPRGQLELARSRFRGISRNREVTLGDTPRDTFFRKFIKFSRP